MVSPAGAASPKTNACTSSRPPWRPAASRLQGLRTGGPPAQPALRAARPAMQPAHRCPRAPKPCMCQRRRKWGLGHYVRPVQCRLPMTQQSPSMPLARTHSRSWWQWLGQCVTIDACGVGCDGQSWVRAADRTPADKRAAEQRLGERGMGSCADQGTKASGMAGGVRRAGQDRAGRAVCCGWEKGARSGNQRISGHADTRLISHGG